MKVHRCSLRSLRGVNFVLVRPDSKVLIQKRCACAPTFPLMYAFPGGAIEDGETPELAVARETLEETGLKLSGFFPLFDVEYERAGQTLYNRVFIASVPRDVEVVSTEGTMHWKTLSEISQLELAMGEEVLLFYIEAVMSGFL